MSPAIKKQEPLGLTRKVLESYKGMKIYKCADIFMTNSYMANAKDFYTVMLPEGTWLYGEGDDPNELLMFGQPRYARQTIDECLNGQRKWSES
jgi:hypothetical protein